MMISLCYAIEASVVEFWHHFMKRKTFQSSAKLGRRRISNHANVYQFTQRSEELGEEQIILLLLIRKFRAKLFNLSATSALKTYIRGIRSLCRWFYNLWPLIVAMASCSQRVKLSSVNLKGTGFENVYGEKEGEKEDEDVGDKEREGGGTYLITQT